MQIKFRKTKYWCLNTEDGMDSFLGCELGSLFFLYYLDGTQIGWTIADKSQAKGHKKGEFKCKYIHKIKIRNVFHLIDGIRNKNPFLP